MKILKKELPFKPIKLTDWRDEYIRSDLMNLCNKNTIKGI